MSVTSPVRWRRAAGALLLSLACVAVAGAAAPPYTEAQPPHGWHPFLHAAKTNPKDQLAYARQLEQAGRVRAAIKQLRALVLTWPTTPEAATAQFSYARLLDDRRDWSAAFDEYTYLIEHYAGTFPYDEVLDRQFRIAKLMMNRRKARFLFFPGFAAPERAVPLFEKIIAHGPEWRKADEAQFLIGRAYELNKQYELAVVADTAVQVHYPHSPYAELAAFGRAVCLDRLSRETPHDEAALEEAWSAAAQFVQLYPKSGQLAAALKLRDELYHRRAQIAFSRADFYDRIARQPKSALIEYRDFIRLYPQSEWAARARQRVEALSRLKEATDGHAQKNT